MVVVVGGTGDTVVSRVVVVVWVVVGSLTSVVQELRMVAVKAGTIQMINFFISGCDFNG